MGVSDTLGKEIKGIALMVIVIVVFSIVLIKLKTQNIANSVCPGGNVSHLYYNAINDSCCLNPVVDAAHLAFNCTGRNTSTISTLGQNINASTTGLAEPITWVVIIIIILVVAWLMKYLKSQNI